MKNSPRALKNGDTFRYLKQNLDSITDAQLEDEIFVGPQIRKIIKGLQLERRSYVNEKAAWK